MNNSDDQATAALLGALARQLRDGLEKIRHCVDQLDEEQLWWRPTPSQNSIANLLLHLEGNVRQWIIVGAGGEPDTRDRPAEFAADRTYDKAQLLAKLTAAVDASVEAISSQTSQTVPESRRIQGFDVTVAEAIVQSVAHFRGHCQEIISLTRQQLEDAYQFHFVPQSAEQGA